MNDPAATLLLDFARQRGVIDAGAEATLRARVAAGADAGIVLATLTSELHMAPALAAALRAEAEAAVKATPPTVPGFRFGRCLGRGAHGTVWQAVQVSLERAVALKIVRADHCADADRFLREARLAGQVRDEHVVACHDAGRHGDWLWLAMELVDGTDAASYAGTKGGRLPERTALKIMRDAAKGCAAIAAAGLVHRDIKPANILLTRTGLAKVADLGVARSLAAAGERTLTRTGEVVGTPAYMAPEQARGDADIDLRADCWALGATLYALVVGEPPYTGVGAVAVLGRIIHEDPPDPAVRRPSITPAVQAIIKAALTRDRNLRYAQPAQIADDCAAVVAGGEPAHALALLAHAGRVERRRAPRTLGDWFATRWPMAASLTVAALALGIVIGAGQPAVPTAVRAARAEATVAAWQAARDAAPEEAAAALALLERTARAQAAAPTLRGLSLQQEVATLRRDLAEAERIRDLPPSDPPATAPVPTVMVPAVAAKPTDVSPSKAAAEATPSAQPSAAVTTAPATTESPPVPAKANPTDGRGAAAPRLQTIIPSSPQWIVIDPRDPLRFVAMANARIVRSDDGGETVSLGEAHLIRTLSPAFGSYSLGNAYWSSHPDRIVVGCGLRGEPDVIALSSSDGGRTFSLLRAPWKQAEDICQLAMAKNGLLAVIRQQGQGSGKDLMTSRDGGLTWQRKRFDGGSLSSALLPVPDGLLFVVDEQDDLCRISANLGERWSIPRSSGGSIAFSLRAYPSAAVTTANGALVVTRQGRIVAVAKDGACAVLADVSRFFKGNDPYPFALAVHPRRTDTWYLNVYKVGLIRTTDRGETWWRIDHTIEASPSSNLPLLTIDDGSKVRLVYASASGMTTVALDETTPDPAHFPTQIDR